MSSSRVTVDVGRPIPRAMSAYDSPALRPAKMASRSSTDKCRLETGGANDNGGIPPAWLNQRLPELSDTPTAAAASATEQPRRTSRQNTR
jgi:hypothetical protein